MIHLYLSDDPSKWGVFRGYVPEDKYIINPEWEKKQLERDISSLENQIQSLTNILAEHQTLLEKKRAELKKLNK